MHVYTYMGMLRLNGLGKSGKLTFELKARKAEEGRMPKKGILHREIGKSESLMIQ